MIEQGRAELAPDDELTIDQVAAATDMTVRNIRAHQSRGLLPPPRIEGRTGYYGPIHVRRLQQIRQMQDEGLNLAAIARVLIDGRLTDVAAGPFREAEGQVVDAEELLARLHLDPDDPAVARALSGGMISVEGDKVRISSPRLVAVAERLTALGVPLGAQLDAVDAVRGAAAEVAAAFMALADEYLVTRVAIDSQGDLDRITTEVEKLRVVAAETLDALFNQAMSQAIADYFASAGTVPEG